MGCVCWCCIVCPLRVFRPCRRAMPTDNTFFCLQVLLCVWQVPVVLPIIFYLVFATLEVTFLSATAEKIPTGGWFSLMMSAIYTTIMLLWCAFPWHSPNSS
jgi:K+ transporter